MHCHVQMYGATLAFADTSRAPLRAWCCPIAWIGRARISQAARRLHALFVRDEGAAVGNGRGIADAPGTVDLGAGRPWLKRKQRDGDEHR